MDPETIAAIRITKDNFRLLNRMLTQIERILEINVLDPKNGSSSPSTAGIGASKAFITSSTGTCDEDRSRIRTGFGPENISRLRRFAVGILKSFQKRTQSISEMMRKLTFKTRIVFDYLRMTQNSSARGFAH